MQSVMNQIQTKQQRQIYDDSYQGYSVAVGEFTGDQVEGESMKPQPCGNVASAVE